MVPHGIVLVVVIVAASPSTTHESGELTMSDMNKVDGVVVAEVVATPEVAAAKPAKAVVVKDIRDTLPLAVKTGTTSKPIWTIDGENFKFVRPLKKDGKDAEGRKPILGKRTLARYKAGVTKSGADLVFVGMFSHSPIVEKAAKPVDETPVAPVNTEMPAEVLAS